MADLRGNFRGYAEAGLTLGVGKVMTDYLVYGTPLYAVVQSLGRYGKGVFDLAFGFALDFADRFLPQLDRFALPGRIFALGLMELLDAFVRQVQGEGFAYITKDGVIKTDPEDTLTAIYMQTDSEVKKVTTGSTSGGLGIVRYVAVGEKKVYSFLAPYKLPEATPEAT